MIRSDMVAAKVLQNAIKEGRGEEVLSPRTSDARSKGAAAAEPPRVEALEKKPEAKQVPKEAPAVLVGASSLASIREKIVDMTKALEGLKAAFEAMSGYRSMIMESDSATDLINRVEGGSGEDGIAARGEVVRHISGGAGSDGITLEARRAVNISGGSGDDAIAVEAMMAWGVSGGTGDDKMQVSGARVARIDGGSGDDKMSVQGLSIKDVTAGSGDDVMSITGKRISGVSDGAGDDVVNVIGGTLTGLKSSEGDDVYNLDVGRAKMSLKQGMGNDVVNLASGSHMQFAISDASMMEAGAVSAVWDGDNLELSFENGDSLVINNAANAGSISMRSGNTVLTLMPPKTEASSGLLDIAV